jgi:hypothetical protein
MTVSERVGMARSQLGQTYLSSLSPSQYAALFPDYYKKFVPSYSSLGGGGGGVSAGAGGASGGGGGGAAGKSEAGTTYSAPQQSSTTKPAWLQKFEQGVLQKTGGETSGPHNVSRIAGGVDRTKFHNEMKDPKVRELFYNMMEAEVGSMGRDSHVAFAETVFNRAQYQNKSIKQILSNKDYYQPYTDGGLSRAEKRMNDNKRSQYSSVLDTVGIGGSDTTNGASHNASGSVARDAVSKYDAVPDTLRNIGGETFYSKTYEQKHRKNLPRLSQDYPSPSAIKDATSIQQRGSGQTGQVTPGGYTLGPSGRATDEATLLEANKRRPGHMAGRVRIGEGEDAFVAAAGSGGRSGKFPSMPFGVHKLGPMVAPGPRLGPTFERMRGRGKTGVVDVPNMFDPSIGRNRQAIQIHPAIAPRDINGDDIKDLISEGCIAVEPSQYDAFMGAYQNYYKENNGNVWIVNVPNPNGEHEWVITNKKPEGNVYTPQQAIDNQKRIGEPLPEIALPDGLNKGIIDHIKTLRKDEQVSFVENIKKYGPDGIQTINSYYEQDMASRTSSDQQKATESIVETIKTEVAPKAFSSAEEESAYYNNLFKEGSKYSGIKGGISLEGGSYRGLCGKGARGMAGALFNDPRFGDGLGGDGTAGSLSKGNAYLQKRGYLSPESTSKDQVKNKEFLDSLPIGTVISSTDPSGGAGHVQTKVGPNMWVSDKNQGNQVLYKKKSGLNYDNFVVHKPGQDLIKNLDPRIVTHPATMEWVKQQGYELSESQQFKTNTTGAVMPEPTLGPEGPTVVPTQEQTITSDGRLEIAGQTIEEGQSLSQEQINAIRLARDLDERNYQNYPEHVRRQYETQTAPSATATPKKVQPSGQTKPQPTATPVNPPYSQAVGEAMAKSGPPDSANFKDYRNDPAVKQENAPQPSSSTAEPVAETPAQNTPTAETAPEKVPEASQGAEATPGENLSIVNTQGDIVGRMNDRESVSIEPASYKTAKETADDVTNFAKDQANANSKESKVSTPASMRSEIPKSNIMPTKTDFIDVAQLPAPEKRHFAQTKNQRPGTWSNMA